MLKNYLLIAWRSLLKNKLFSIINVFGLALAMSVGILVLISITDALIYDTFHPDPENVYRIVSKITNPQGDNWTFASSPLPLNEAIREQTSGSVISTHIYPSIHSVIKDETREFDFNGAFIEPSFFTVFGFKMSPGNPSALSKPNTLLLSETFAAKFFGDTDPTGRSITIQNFGEFEIIGILKTAPAKSHIDYDVFVSMSSVPALERANKLPASLNDWNSFEHAYTYVHVNDEKELLVNSLARISGDINRRSGADQQGRFDFELQPLNSITPGPSDMYNDIGRGPTRGGIAAELGIVMLVLVAACFNYTNLSIARALTRSKEIGVRKLSGATRQQIIAQYVIEAVLISILALVFANIIVAPILQYKPFNDGYEMIPDVNITWQLAGFVLGFAVFAGLMAGLLPAWLLSSFKPVRVLRGVATEKLMGRMSLRKTLLVFQFSLSLVVVVFLSTFYRQFTFLACADPGFDRENVIIIPKGNHAEATMTSFTNINGVEKVGFTSARFGNGGSMSISREVKSTQPVTIEYYSCDRNWIEIMGLNVIAGSIDISRSAQVILSEKAVSAAGFSNSDEAVGSTIYLRDSVKTIVVGVVKDFYSRGFGNQVQPIVFQADSTSFRMLAVKAANPDPNLIRTLETAWKKNNPSHSFDYISLGDQERNENSQSATISLLGYLGFITLTIASLGLLGLVVYTVEVKRKEISIRKIVGASVRSVVMLLSGGFLSLLMIAAAIALPIGYLLSEFFLTNFVNHVTVTWAQMFACFLVLMSTGLITTLSQTLKAASENPAHQLKNE